jgi:hypothetical protein
LTEAPITRSLDLSGCEFPTDRVRRDAWGFDRNTDGEFPTRERRARMPGDSTAFVTVESPAVLQTASRGELASRFHTITRTEAGRVDQVTETTAARRDGGPTIPGHGCVSTLQPKPCSY